MGIESVANSQNTKKYKSLVAATICNYLEIFDFTIYSLYATILSRIFFADMALQQATFLTIIIFTISFLTRPIGALCLGMYSDRFGAKKAMFLCTILMSIGSFCIAFAPTPQQAGALGIIMLIIGRMVQGIAAGGHLGSGLALLAHNATDNNRTFITSLQVIVQSLSHFTGAAIGFLLGRYLTDYQLESWGWRIPFLFGLLILPAGIWLVKNVSDAPIHKMARKTNIMTVLHHHARHYILLILIVGSGAAGVYITNFYLGTYFTLIGKHQTDFLWKLLMGSAILSLIATPLHAVIIDKLMVKHKQNPAIRNNYILVSQISGLVFLVLYFCNVHNNYLFALFYILSNISFNGLSACFLLHFSECFPKNMRATAISTSYAILTTIFGGSAQLIVTYLLKLTNNHYLAPLIWLLPLYIMGIIATIYFRPIRYKD